MYIDTMTLQETCVERTIRNAIFTVNMQGCRKMKSCKGPQYHRLKEHAGLYCT